MSCLQPVAELPSVRYLYLHLITNFTGMEVGDFLHQLCNAFPGRMVVASGEALKYNDRNFDNLTVLRSDQQIHDFIQRSEDS